MARPDGPRSLDRRTLPPLALLPYEKLLAETLRGFLAELCLTNAGVVMSYISHRRDENMDDLIASSAELFLKPGCLRYARRATIETDWGTPPHVSIDMTFACAQLRAAFRIVFAAAVIGVNVDRIEFASGGPEEDGLARFAAALASARLAGH